MSSRTEGLQEEKTLVLTNKHHFCQYTRIEIKDGKVTKFIHGLVKDVTHPKTISEFIAKIRSTFVMVGIDKDDDTGKYLPCMVLDGVLIKDEKKAQEIKEIIYSEPLEFPFVLVQQMVCSCNNTYWGLNPREHKTYGDLIREFGSYYPDSVYLAIEEVFELPNVFVCCNGLSKEISFKLDPTKKYIKWCYYR